MARGHTRGHNKRGRGNHGGQRFNHRGKSHGRGGGKGRGDFPPEDFTVYDYQVQVWNGYEGYAGPTMPSTPTGRGRGNNGYRGNVRGQGAQRGRGSAPPSSGVGTPTRGRGGQTPGRGRNHAGIGSPTQQTKQQPRLGANAPLSSLLYETRPLLRPVIFVRSTMTPFLFQIEEEILKPGVEDVDDVEKAQITTANRVAEMFDGTMQPESGSAGSGESGEEDVEEIEEIDFYESQRLLDVASKSVKKSKQAKEETFTGFFKLPTPPMTDQSVQHELTSPPLRPHSLDVDVVEKKVAGIAITSPMAHTNELPAQDAEDIVMDTFQEQGVTTGVVTQEDEASQLLPVLEKRTSDDTILLVSEGVAEGGEMADVNGMANELSPDAPKREVLASDAGVFTTQLLGQGQRLTPSKPLEEEGGGFYIDTTAAVVSHISSSQDQAPEESRPASFFVDTTPATISAFDRMPTSQQALGDQDDEIIVYIAPHPRSGRTTPAVPDRPTPSALPKTSILTGLSTIVESSEPTDAKHPRKDDEEITPQPASLSFTSRPAKRRPRQFVSPLLLASPSTQHKAKLRVRRQEARFGKKKKDKRSLFSFRAATREDKLWGLQGEERDPKWDERRRGDSDIDWGDEKEDEDEEEQAGEEGGEGMDVDLDLHDEKTVKAMRSFAESMLGQERSKFVTMDDIADGDKLREEDEGSQGGAEGSSEGAVEEDNNEDEDDEDDDEDEAMRAILEEEEKMIGEDSQDISEDEDREEEDDESSSDDGLSPRSSFKARLERARKFSEKGKAKQMSDDDENENDRDITWGGDVDEDELLNQLGDILDRKEKNQRFKAIKNGDFVDLVESFVAGRKKDKVNDLPQYLQDQWERDRQKKAKRKLARQLAKLEAAFDPLAKKKGGKKGHKAMLAAARIDSRITVIRPNRVIDMTTLVQQIRRFLAEPGGPPTMSLPPANEQTRKLIHEMAAAFQLKSKSHGNGEARYTTLIKTSRSGLMVDEDKVAKLVRRGSSAYSSNGGGKGKPVTSRRAKEGEEVGKAAPKIDSSNRGFKMLEAMGWSEGKRIGIMGGLDQPLTAIIKHSKLGLGATKQ